MASFDAIVDGLAVYIALNKRMKDRKGNILLTPDMMSNNEIDEYVKLLVSQIEKAGKQAKKKLIRVNEKVKKDGLYSRK